jgi:type 2 lantibiotic biosynthesis protein LanM
MGVAFFLAALTNLTGTEQYRDLSLRAVTPIRTRLKEIVADPNRASELKLRIGGLVGLGALMYSFIHIASWVREPSLTSDARDLLDLFTSERIEGDKDLDIVAGSAGAILALLAMEQIVRNFPQEEGKILQIAEKCVRHLLSRRIVYEGRPRAWVTLTGFPPLTGFAHGAAGICYALLRFYKRTQNAEALAAAKEGIAFERSLFSSRHKNWRDLRHSDERFMVSWCHGAPGIALGRLGSLDVIDDIATREEICNALSTTIESEEARIDHLCCGNMGRVEILLFASQRISDSDYLLDAAHALTRKMLDSAGVDGHFRWLHQEGADIFSPSFFTGAAGVGYAFLRLAAPNQFPCVLLLE